MVQTKRSSGGGDRSRRGDRSVRSTRRLPALDATAEEQKFVNRGEEGQLTHDVAQAKAVRFLEQHQNRPGQNLVTQSHDVIREWAEERNARPATMASDRSEGVRPTVLLFTFPDEESAGLAEMDWAEWFTIFDEGNLVLLYEEETAEGEVSYYYEIDSPKK